MKKYLFPVSVIVALIVGESFGSTASWQLFSPQWCRDGVLSYVLAYVAIAGYAIGYLQGRKETEGK